MNKRYLMKRKVLYIIAKKKNVCEYEWDDPFLGLKEIYSLLLKKKPRIKKTRFDKDERKGGI